MKTAITTVCACAMMLAAPALAQTEAYETPGYKPSARSVLDPQYGLPSFGMPDADLPQQRTMATPGVAEKPPVPATPPPDYTVPIGQDARIGDAAPVPVPETPLYTTSETGDDATTDDEAR